MLRKLAHLLFGGEEDASEELRSEEVEEEWLVVDHHEDMNSAEIPSAEAATILSDSAPNAMTITKLETTSVTDPASEQSTVKSKETAGNIQAISTLLSSPKALQEVTKLTCMQKSCTSHHPVSRNAIQQHNRGRRGFQRHSFPLQQPGHRTLSH